MKHRPLKQLCGLLASAAIALVLIGCNGKAGQDGSNGTNGTNGTNGNNGNNAAVTINAAALTPDEWGNTTFKGSIQNVAVSLASGKPVVNFTLTDGFGTPVSGFGAIKSKASTALVPSYPNVSFTIAKLMPAVNGSPTYWMNYVVTTMPNTTTAAAPGKPSTDNTGTLVDHLDGTYTYTFYRDITAAQAFLNAYTPYTAPNVRADLGDVTFDPTLTHRVSIQVGGNARGTSTNTPDGSNTGIVGVPVKFPANVIYDFVPSRPVATQAVTATDTQRQVVDIDACNRCHSKLTVHGGGRIDTQYCVICHTDQRKYGAAEATSTTTAGITTYTGSTTKINGLAAGNLVAFLHRLHMGEGLTNQGYNYANILFNDIRYPQDQRNCIMCHTGTASSPYVQAQGDNWMNVPSRLACGACHDSVNFVTGLNHGPASNPGKVQLDDKNCTGCHGPSGVATAHTPVAGPDMTNGGLTVAQGGVATNTHTNASFVGGALNNLPAGAHWFKWNIKSVSVNASKQPVWVFNFLQDGVTPVVFNTYSAGVKDELMDNYVGGPNLYMAFTVPQDGIATPNDWNSTVSTNLRKIWRGGAAAGSTFTGPDASGFYTATLAGVTVPANAKMITGGIGYFYGLVAAGTAPAAANTDSLPLTQINLATYPYNFATIGGVSVAAPYQGGFSAANPNQWLAASGQTARRAIVTTAKCNDCHFSLGVFTDHVFHAGQRNDGPTCTFCHNVNGVDSGWSYNIKEAVHSIHAGGKRATPFTWEAVDKYWEIEYPAILNNCEACHVPGSYDFSASGNAAQVSNLLWTTVASGTMNAAGIKLTNPALYDSTKSYISPWVNAGQNYGQGLQINTTTAAKPATTWMGVTIPLAVGATFEAEPTTLVNSPIASACYACHDSVTAKAHIVGNGGSLQVLRSSVTTAVAGVTTVPIVQNEQCLICHGNGKVADIRAMHMTWK